MIGPLSWVLIYVSDIDTTRHFYERVLELPLKSVRPQIVVFRTGACTLELMAKLDNGPQPAEMDDARGWRRNKVLVSFHVEDIEAEVAAIEQRGGKCISGINPTVGAPWEPPKGRIAQFMDPEGNIIELCQEPLD
jgi:predicted enzyme related to lactoylglutathione lyase